MAGMDPDIRAVIRAAMEAPSGENAQPWRFHVEENAVELRHHAESDRSLYNYNNYGTFVCEGAALENMNLAARALGYSPRIVLFPQGNHSPVIARIELGKRGAPENDAVALAAVIPRRTTNRKKYETAAIPLSAGKAMEKACADFAVERIRLFRITERKAISRLAAVASTNERVMLGNRELHDFFFNHLTWTPEEDREKKVGFFIKTLELPLPVQGLFKILRHWPVMRILKAVGFPVLVGKVNAVTYAASSEIDIITIPDMRPASFIAAGRMFERIWLTGVAYGLSAQPLTGTTFMNFFVEAVPDENFSPTERLLIAQEAAVLRRSVPEKSGIPAIMYRIGSAAPPSARATRFALDDLLV